MVYKKNVYIKIDIYNIKGTPSPFLMDSEMAGSVLM